MPRPSRGLDDEKLLPPPGNPDEAATRRSPLRACRGPSLRLPACAPGGNRRALRVNLGRRLGGDPRIGGDLGHGRAVIAAFGEELSRGPEDSNLCKDEALALRELRDA